MPTTSTGSGATVLENGLYTGISLQDTLYGIELVLYFMTMGVLLTRRRQRHKSDIFYALFSTTMFVLITIWAVSITTSGQKMWLQDRNYPGGPMGYYTENSSAVYLVFGRVALTILQQMADALMIYRCQIVWGNCRVTLLLSIIWLANLGLGILLDWSCSMPGTIFYSGMALKFGLMHYSVSAFLNLTMSGMICYRLLFHARIIKAYLGDKHASPYMTIIAILIESMLPYMISSIVFLVSYGIQSECISPQMLILHVAKREAWKKDESGLPESIIRDPVGHGDASDGTGVVDLVSLPSLASGVCSRE